jgi:hypothetical protein
VYIFVFWQNHLTNLDALTDSTAGDRVLAPYGPDKIWVGFIIVYWNTRVQIDV